MWLEGFAKKSFWKTMHEVWPCPRQRSSRGSGRGQDFSVMLSVTLLPVGHGVCQPAVGPSDDIWVAESISGSSPRHVRDYVLPFV